MRSNSALRRLLVAFTLVGAGMVCSGQIRHSFYAVYTRLFDSNILPFAAQDFDFSGDGKTVVVGGIDNLYGEPVLYSMNSDGSNLQSIPLPSEVSSIQHLTIDSSGSVAYFYSHPFVYRAKEGNVTGIFNLFEETGFLQLYGMETCGSGEFVFMMPPSTYYTGDLLRIGSDGSGLETVVNNEDVIRDGGYAGKMNHFSVNHDGTKIAFVMEGFNGEDGYRQKAEVFLKDQDGYHQITNESAITRKYHSFISGDGNTIVFSYQGEEWKWFSIRADGSGRVPVADHGFNFAGLDITYDGSVMVHGEGSGNGGCLVACDGSFEREIFAQTYPWKLSLFHLAKVRLSDDGSRICFMFDAMEDGVRTFSMYVGHFDNPFAVQDAPLIEGISIVPSAIPDIPQVPVNLTTQVSDPQGSGDVNLIACNELVEGRKLGSGDVPVYFPWDLNDLGEGPDRVAGDGIYSGEGWTRDHVAQFSEAGIRIGVVDHSWNVVVADTVFEVREIAAPGVVNLLLPEPGANELDTGIQLAWSSVTEAQKYHLQLSLDELFSIPVMDDELMDTTVFISGLETDTDYFWRVRAFNGVEYGGWSDVSSFETKTTGVVDGIETGRWDQGVPVIWPNPVYMGEEIHFLVPDREICKLQIYDARGGSVYKTELEVPAESLSVPTGIFAMSDGIFIYKVTTRSVAVCGLFHVLKR